jgi:hypothetical protein
MLALDAFVSSLEGKDMEYPTLTDGMVAQSIADAAVESLQKNVPVPISYWQPPTVVQAALARVPGID